ncbi:uncharacterized protein LOC113516490 isoform X2 [Galleria mellonella]|uniref:Uncharacterized protein LOC113516490 isoform X2 n=1 Tax=Galleria mellonella TaxID=7137 RepID=A0ABM3N0J1_GALME|nr:uncharacterized protein LOC113516490 isoform X2 [Galleria mellonella]
MVEPEKPFACTIADCGMTFTNEDHLHVHTKKHDMVLQLGLEQKAAFVDQTPTPTRFIRNCEEVGLFLDLQSEENPFDEGFKRAMESAKHGLLSMEPAAAVSSTDDLHTPQMVFPMIDHADSALYSATNNQRNITISRSSSDESGVIKEYETTTISKLTNEVTTISRRVEKHDVVDKAHDDTRHTEAIRNKDILNETVSYTNNIIKIRKDLETSKNCHNPVIITTDSVMRDVNNVSKDVSSSEQGKHMGIPPMMSQKSYDFVVDSLTSDICRNEQVVDSKKKPQPTKSTTDSIEEYTVTITLPGGKQIRMKSVDSDSPEKSVPQCNTKEKLKKALTNKLTNIPVIQNVPVTTNLPIAAGTLIPVTILHSNHVNKIPITPLNVINNREIMKPIKRRRIEDGDKKQPGQGDDDDCVVVDSGAQGARRKLSDKDLDSRVAASRRYRQRLKKSMAIQELEIKQLNERNQRLTAENAKLKLLITEHMKNCPNADDLRIIQEKMTFNTSTNI